MKVKCAHAYPTEEDIGNLGESFHRHQRFGVTPGVTYLVLGVSFNEVGGLGRGFVVRIDDDSNQPSVAPLCLFEVVDPRLSRYWTFSADDRIDAFGLAEMRDSDFVVDVFEWKPDAVARYKEIVKRLENEAASSTEG